MHVCVVVCAYVCVRALMSAEGKMCVDPAFLPLRPSLSLSLCHSLDTAAPVVLLVDMVHGERLAALWIDLRGDTAGEKEKKNRWERKRRRDHHGQQSVWESDETQRMITDKTGDDCGYEKARAVRCTYR